MRLLPGLLAPCISAHGFVHWNVDPNSECEAGGCERGDLNSPNRHQNRPLILNANPHGREDLLVTPLQAKVMEAKGFGKVPDQFIYQSGPIEDEELYQELVKKFGPDFMEKLESRPDKGFQGFASVDGLLGGTWRIIRDIKGMWHIPMYFGEGESWVDKKINVDFWGDQANVMMSGKEFITKVQEEWQRATCLEIDTFEDDDAAQTWIDSVLTDPFYDPNNGGFLHPNFGAGQMHRVNRLKAINGDGCWSYVGRVHLRQEISFIDTWCAGSVNSALHEMMHAMGFSHEQSRFDRDSRIFLDGDVCNNDSWFFWLRLKIPQNEWLEMFHPLGKFHDHTSIMHYGSWICSATQEHIQTTIDGSLTSQDGKQWREYGFLTQDGLVLPTGRNERNRFRISDLVQINEAYNCNDRSNDNMFHTTLLYCDDDSRSMYPIGWKCDGYQDCADNSDESHCNIVLKDGTGGTLGGGLGSLASGDWINLPTLKLMSAGVRTDHTGQQEYACLKYGYRIVDDGVNGIKCQCAPWAGDGVNFGVNVDVSQSNCDTIDPNVCDGKCDDVTDANCQPKNDEPLGYSCCPNSMNTEYKIINGACQEVDRCADGTHHCMSAGYGAQCDWTKDVGYTCSCRIGYTGTGCSYRAFVEGEGGCDENWGATINAQNDITQFPYYATCHAQDACATNTDDCVPTATCTSLNERYSRGFFGTYECTCPNGETGDGKQSGTGCSGDVCSTNANTCITTDTDGNSINACISTGSSTFDCVCPDTHVGDANDGGSCTLKVNECADGSHTCDTSGGQKCVDLDAGFTCECIMPHAPEYGYLSSGSHDTGDLLCVDVDECNQMAQPCAPRNSLCTNLLPHPDTCVDLTGEECFHQNLVGGDGKCPPNTACGTHKCECDDRFHETSFAVFLNNEFYDFPGMLCDDPKDFDNCNAPGEPCVDPFCAHDCTDAQCLDTGTIFYDADSDSYAAGFICDCRAVGMYGNGRGGCTSATCPADSTSVDSANTVFHSATFPAVVEDYDCLCNEGFFDSLEGSHDGKEPICTADPCFTDNGGCDANADCIRINAVEVECQCKSGFEMNQECENINECTTNTHNCSNGDNCVDTEGSFECVTPKDCQCNTNTVLGLISNTNNQPFALGGECDTVAKKKKPEDWTVFCDEDGNGIQNGDEQSISFTMNKKCKKIDSGTTSISCGSGDDEEPPVDCNCNAKPKDCADCDAKCISVQGSKVEIEFTCPAGSENAGASTTIKNKCKKIAKANAKLECDGATALECTCKSQADAAAAAVGAKAECIVVNKKKPTYRFFCDDNGNGKFDNGENNRTDKDKCKKLTAGNLNC